MTSTSYCKKIEEIFDAMIRLSEEVLPENRKEVNRYIGFAWEEVTTFARSIKWENGTEDIRAKFQSHVDVEEARLQKNLEDIKYDIDSDDVVPLISGHGRIETVWSLSSLDLIRLSLGQTLLPMLYLLLKRDLQRISLARKHVLSDSELPDALETILCITLAVQYRIVDLRGEKTATEPINSAHSASLAIFEQQSSSPTEQFATFAKGLVGITSLWVLLDLSHRHDTV